MSKIVKSTQSCSNGHLPCHCLFLSARARCMMWRVNLRAQYRCAVAMGANVLNRYLPGSEAVKRLSLIETIECMGGAEKGHKGYRHNRYVKNKKNIKK